MARSVGRRIGVLDDAILGHQIGEGRRIMRQEHLVEAAQDLGGLAHDAARFRASAAAT